MKSLTAALFTLFICFSALAQQTEEFDILKGSWLMSMPGTTYIYEVDFKGSKYDFTVALKDNSAEKGLAFAYKMTNAPGTSGTVHITNEARNTARMQNNYFSGGEMNLTDMTTVWISKQVYDELEKTGESKISTDGGATWVVLQRKYYNYDFVVKLKDKTLNDKTLDDVPYMYCESTDGSAKYWIHAGGNPLVLKMDLGWSITLKQFKAAGE